MPTGRPPSDLRRCLGALRDLSRVAPVVVLAGNHDSPALMEALDFAVNAFAGDASPGAAPRLRFVTRARHPRDGGILDYPARGGEQRIRLAPLPFVHQNRFLDSFTSPGTATRDYAQHLREVQAELMAGLRDGYQDGRDVLVFAAHLYVGGAIPSHTERRVDIDRHLRHRRRRPAAGQLRRTRPHPPAPGHRRLRGSPPGTPAARCSWTSARPARTRASSWSTPTPAARSGSTSCR